MQQCGVLNRKENISDAANDKDSIKTNIDEYVIPNQLPYIPWRQENRTIGSAAISAKADRRSGMRDTPTVNELNSGKVEDINAAAARATTTAASIALRFETSIQKDRHMEFRNMTNYVIGDIFRSVISSADIEKNLVRSATAQSVGLRLPEDLNVPELEGIPVHGVYYDEIKKPEDVIAAPKMKEKEQSSRPCAQVVIKTPREPSEDEMQVKADLLLATEDGFKEIVSDIMHNTIFNLMQEASFGEFPVNAEPLRFAIVKKPNEDNE